MASHARADRPPRPLWLTRNGILLALALLSSAVAWWMIAWPVATLSNVAAHQGHFWLTFAHMIGGAGMLWLGGVHPFPWARDSRRPPPPPGRGGALPFCAVRAARGGG